MGMSASQARYLALQARMSDCEYQGQQINQQRTTLANQINALYNSLLEMTVPTPPSTRDYMKIVYKGVDGASKFTVDNVLPQGTTYTIDFKYEKTGHGVESVGSATASYTQPTINLVTMTKDQTWVEAVAATPAYIDAGVQITNTDNVTASTNIMVPTDRNDVGNKKAYKLEQGKFIALSSDELSQYNGTIYTQSKPKVEDDNKVTVPNGSYVCGTAHNGTKGEEAHGKNAGAWSQYYILNSDGTVRCATEDDFENNCFKEGLTYLKQGDNGQEYANPAMKYSEFTVAGHPCMDLQTARDENWITSDEALDDLKASIVNKFPDRDPEDFLVYFTTDTGIAVPHFVDKKEMSIFQKNENGTKQVTSYDYIANGQYTSNQTIDGCKLEFDNSGRITKVAIPKYDDEGNLLGYTDCPLEATEEADEIAYQDAFNDYTYQKSLYDQEQQRINAKTSIIQQEDKNLELKLTRLDNERNAINTELEAVKKVIQDAIDKGFKTFNG